MKRSFLIILVIVVALLGLQFLPKMSFLGYNIRQVNLLADVTNDSSAYENGENTDEIDEKAEYVHYHDSIPKGIVAIEDFRDSMGIHREMDRFYAALKEAKKRVVRIAYFGDSFIEGDILTAPIRELLQTKYGGCGVGFIDIMSQVAGFRTTVSETSSGWNDFNIVNHGGKGFNKDYQGINSRYYLPMGTAYIEAKGQQRTYAHHLDTVPQAIIYFTPEPGLTMRKSINNGEFTTFYESADTLDSCIRDVKIIDKIGRIKVEVNGKGRFYGMALEGKTGVVLDNFSMRGSAGWHLGSIPMNILKQFASLRDYDLIIMHYGINIAEANKTRYTGYCNRFKNGLRNFREAFPNASILVFSMSDRDVRGSNGQFQTMPGVKELTEAQRVMAEEEGVAYWNLLQGMGGSGSMYRLQQENRANRDYTHINFRGGEVIGKAFFDALMVGKTNYDRRVKLNPRIYANKPHVSNSESIDKESELTTDRQ